MLSNLKQKLNEFDNWVRVKIFGEDSPKVHLLNLSIEISSVLLGLVIVGSLFGIYFGRHWVWGRLLEITGTKALLTHQTSPSNGQGGGSGSQSGGSSSSGGSGGSGGSGDSGGDDGGGDGGGGECPPGEDCPCPPHFSGKNCRSRDFTEVGWAIPCSYARSLNDDPILDFGKPGKAALNDFRGNLSADANSTYGTLSANKSDWICNFKPGWDHSATWTPHMYLNGNNYRSGALFTYHLLPKGVDPATMEPLPDGIKLMSDAAHVLWSCSFYNTKIHSKDPTNCQDLKNPRDPTKLSNPDAWITLPNCWDGNGLGYQHTVYPDGTSCPASNPHVFPRIKFQFDWEVPNQNATGATFATADGQNNGRVFAEFYDAWKPGVFSYLTTYCLGHQIPCGSVANACNKIYKTLGVWDEAICGKNKHA